MANPHPARRRSLDRGPVVLAGSIGLLLIAAVVLIVGYATSFGGHLRITQSRTLATEVSAPIQAAQSLAILTESQLGHGALGPAYVPSSFAVPAHAAVTVTVTDFDTATPLTGKLVRYAKVTGTVGNRMTVQPIDVLAPNRLTAPTRTLAGLAPSQVGHTFTVAALHLNVPMAGDARTTFTFHTGAPGTYQWICMDPCGSGPGGLGGVMGRPGYMAGTLTVVG